MPTDRFDQPLTTSSDRAAELYDAAVDRLFELQPGADELIDQALVLDGDFALAHCVKARALMAAGAVAQARQAATRGRQLASGLGERERRHAQIVWMVLHDQRFRALGDVIIHAMEFPRDAVPLSFALGVYGLLGFSGSRDFHAEQLELLDRVAPAWRDDDWWFLAAHGWACVEAGELIDGIDMLDAAFELNPRNANAVHGRVHGYYEAGAPAAGESLLAEWLPGYSRAAPLHGHLAWHQALFALQRGDGERAAGIYRDAVQPAASRALPMFTLIDCAAFAMRAELHGEPLSSRDKRRIAEFADAHFANLGVPFLNVHVAMAYACADDVEALREVEFRVGELLREGRQASGAVVARVCHAIAAYRVGSYSIAASTLAASQHEFERLGGSHAQRDVLVDLLIAARFRAGHRHAAPKDAAARWERRAHHLDEAWLARFRAAQPEPPVVIRGPRRKPTSQP